MLIGKNWKLESDTMNITLLKRFTNRKTKKDYWTAQSYFANPNNALDYLVNHEIMGTGFKDFETVCKKIKELETLITGLDISLKPHQKR